MNTATEDASPTLEAVIEEFLNSGTKSGNYKSNLRSALQTWVEWLADRAITEVEGVNKRAMAKYAENLQQRIKAGKNPDVDGGISAPTAWTYYDYISAFLDWCVEWEYIRENPAQKGIVKNELPDRPNTESGSQQFWSAEVREDLIGYVDEQAAEAVYEEGLQAVAILRDRALAYVLAYSGVRGGEVLQDPRDDRRGGLRWEDVEIEASRATVLGKDQQREAVQLPEQTHQPLKQLQRAVDPPNGEWPVFHSNHAPSLHSVLPEDWERPEEDEENLLDHCRTFEVVPPALSTNGGRTVMKRLCEDADIDIDGEYLKPHGGRRGAGETLYRELDAAAAQRALRHKDPATTSKMYSHIDATELAEDTSEAFENS